MFGLNALTSWFPWKRGMEKDVENENAMLNVATYNAWLYKFLNVALSVYEWEGLPTGIDQRQLEMWLLTRGYAIFFYDEALVDDPGKRAPEGYAVLQGVAYGEWDLYDIPNERRVYAPMGFQRELDETNSVIMFHNQLRTPEVFTYEMYARRIAELDRTIDVNVMAQKTNKVIRCDDLQRLTWKNIAMQAEGNVYTILADKSVDLKDLEVLDLSAELVALDLDVLKQRYVAEAFQFAGVESVPPEKRERLVTSEVTGAMGGTEALRFSRLCARQQACEQINELFGLDVSVRYREGTYVTGTDLEDPDPQGMGEVDGADDDDEDEV